MVRFSGFVATRDTQTAQILRTIQSDNGFGRINQQGGATFFTFEKGRNMDVQDALSDRNVSPRNYEYSPFGLSSDQQDAFVAGESITRSQR